ncbi:aspartate kinase [Caldibacillus thermoamylovorans]|uniref:aspartate kinase n=1 Tax=Caldibacillus thermoamylovorans TaxID=35841 RepID=UPI00203E743F|nr:aspartate kinase [Caldibacillus thermoamylovorans]MCM3799335.1 aspartate kinase [Caldibacillus thermoamylovorans]
MKVVKFGGTSVSSAEQIKKVFQIVTADPERKIVVVSAPGKRKKDDIKVTDLLIKCGEEYCKTGNGKEAFLAVVDRYAEIAHELGVSEHIIDRIAADLQEILHGDRSNASRFMDAVKASGEDNSAKLIAAYFQSCDVEAYYVNPKEAGLFLTDEPGNAQVLPEAYEQLKKLRDRPGILIFPGFFGYSKTGEIVTFSRGGSDITGSILASAVGATVYENFTDVDAVYTVNPNFVDNPKEIHEITYKEMRELSYGGFGVFHDEALIPVFRTGVSVNIKNTNNPNHPGTKIVHHRNNQNGPVVGIASDTGFSNIYVNKYLMNREIGFGRRLLQILEDFHLSYEHTPSGIDDISVILRQNQLDLATERQVLERIKTELHADEVHIEHDLAMIMIVGEGMRQAIGTMSRAAAAFARSGVNILMINQGSSEVSMMFGVKAADEKKAVQALYEEFFN